MGLIGLMRLMGLYTSLCLISPIGLISPISPIHFAKEYPEEDYETNVRNYESRVDGRGATRAGRRSRIGSTAAVSERRGHQGQDARQQRGSESHAAEGL